MTKNKKYQRRKKSVTSVYLLGITLCIIIVTVLFLI